MNSNQNNFGASIGSSSNENNETNFITQQNFVNNSPPNNVKNKNQTQNNLDLNQNKKENITSVSTKKKNVKRSKRMKTSKNPKKTMKGSMWGVDSFDNPENDEEYLSQRKRDKILKMIKNAHVEKLKNYIFLKEINNAHDEIQRLSQVGEMAEAKEMERELNTLHASVIQLNIDAFSKTKMAKSHALFGQTYSTFKDNKSQNINRRNMSKSTRTTNIERAYNSTSKKYIYRNNEENEEEEEVEEEEEKRIKKRKNKNKSLNNKKLGNNKNVNEINPINNFNNKNIQDNSGKNFPNNIPYNIYTDIYNNNSYPPNNNYYQNQLENKVANQVLNQVTKEIPKKMQNQIQNKNEYSNMGNNPNSNLKSNEYLQPKFNQGYNFYPPEYNQQIQFKNENYNPELYNNYLRQNNNVQKNYKSNNIGIEPPKMKDKNKNETNEKYINEKENNDNNDYNKGYIPEKEYNKENNENRVKPENQNVEDSHKFLFSINTISSTVVEPNSEKQLPLINEKENIKSQINPNKENKLRTDLSPPFRQISLEKEQNPEILNKNEELSEYPNDLNQNKNEIPNEYRSPYQYSFSPEQQNQELKESFQKESKNDTTKKNDPSYNPYNNPKNEDYLNYQNRLKDNILSFNPKKKEKKEKKNYPNKYYKQRSPEKKSPNYKPKKSEEQQTYYNIQPKKDLRNNSPNKMRRPQSSKSPFTNNYNPLNPYEPYFYNKYEYPRRYRPGSSLSRSKSKSASKEDRKLESKILFAYPSSGRCFACDVKCSISTSGNSPNKYVPYKGSFKVLRERITDYDAERYGYYQYKSRFQENN